MEAFVLEKATAKGKWSILVVRAILTQMRVSVESRLVVPVIATNTSVIVDVSELRQHVTNCTRVVRRLWRRCTLHIQQPTLQSINQSINTFITRHGTEARATVRIMPKQRELS